MLNICFIVDGGSALGLGHIQQSTTFATALSPGADVNFLTKSSQNTIDKISEYGFNVNWFASDDDIILHLGKTSPDIVIFDKIDVDEELARIIKESLKIPLVIFTNLTAANKYADIAVTADIGSQFKNIIFSDETTGTTYYYGPRYWVLRPEFYLYRKLCKSRQVRPQKILLIFGGSDPTNLTAKALEVLLQKDSQLKIDIILGAHYGHDEDLLRVLSRHDSQLQDITIHRNIPNVAQRMYEADLVIASPGLSAFEALCVGTPVIVIPHDGLQRDTYKGFMCLIEPNEISNLTDTIEEGNFTYPDDPKIALMEIGDGVEELKEVIMNLTKRMG